MKTKMPFYCRRNRRFILQTISIILVMLPSTVYNEEFDAFSGFQNVAKRIQRTAQQDSPLAAPVAQDTQSLDTTNFDTERISYDWGTSGVSNFQFDIHGTEISMYRGFYNVHILH